LVERILYYVVIDDNDCWLFTGRLSQLGYVAFHVGHGTVKAHRVIYEYVNGPIPPGLEIDHLCRVRHCLNPEHMEPVTHRENVLRSIPYRIVTAHTRELISKARRGKATRGANYHKSREGI